MADRTSASLFATLFEHLAHGKALDVKKLWDMTRGCDFSPYQMGCDAALQDLGLMWICKPCPENEVTNNYGPDVCACTECGSPKPTGRRIREWSCGCGQRNKVEILSSMGDSSVLCVACGKTASTPPDPPPPPKEYVLQLNLEVREGQVLDQAALDHARTMLVNAVIGKPLHWRQDEPLRGLEQHAEPMRLAELLRLQREMRKGRPSM